MNMETWLRDELGGDDLSVVRTYVYGKGFPNNNPNVLYYISFVKRVMNLIPLWFVYG